MNIIDIIFIFPLGLFIIIGFRKGIVIELFSIVALIFGIIGSMKLTHIIVSSISENFMDAEWIPYVVYLLVFIGIYVLVRFLGKFVEKVVKNSNLGLFNRLAGSILGAFKVIFMFSLLIWLTDQIDVIPQSMKDTSVSYRYIKPVAPHVITIINKIIPIARDIVEQIEGFFDQIISDVSSIEQETQ